METTRDSTIGTSSWRGLATAMGIASMLAAGCGVDDQHLGEPLGSRTAAVLQMPAVPCPADSLISWEFAGSACTDIPGAGGGKWRGRRLLRMAQGTYCNYRWIPGAMAQPDLTAVSQLSSVAVDCPVVGALGAIGAAEKLADALRDNYRRQVGWVAKLPQPQAQIRVAVVDSAARSYDRAAKDTYAHGRAVGRVIGDIGCPKDGASGCPVQVRNHLALPLITPHAENYTRGGYYGTRAHLVRGVVGAVKRWLKDSKKGGDPARLVINLSLGWDAVHGGPFYKDPSELSPDARAVYDALRFARCADALVVAAAGNRSLASDTGPMYPAGWEAMSAPTPNACKRLGFRPAVQPSPLTKGGYHPLVYAVSGVDEGDRPLPTTRSGGQARIVAHAMSVVTDDPVRPPHPPILSGTSMASAVVSGIAATAWGFDPSLSPDQVMQLVYDGGKRLRRGELSGYATTDICLGSVRCEEHRIRRASLCGVLSPMLGDLSCKTVAAHRGQPAFDSDMSLPTAGLELLRPIRRRPCLGIGCPPVVLTSKQERPWVGPQPGFPSCEACLLGRASGLFLGSLSDGASDGVKEMRLNTQTWFGPRRFELDAPSSDDFVVGLAPDPNTWGASLRIVYSVGYTNIVIVDPVAVY